MLVDDIATLKEKMQNRWPELPYFLFGHSMGSMIVRLYLARCTDGDLDGCILSGCPAPNAAAGIGIHLANSVIRSHGPMYRSSMLNSLIFKHYTTRIQDCQSPFDWLTRDRAVVSLFQSDAKCNYIFTASGFRDLCYLMQNSSRLNCMRETSNSLPLLFLAGDADPVGSYGTGVKRLASSYRAAGCRNVDMIFYKDARHEILNELNKEEVYGDISRWLEAQLAQRAVAAGQMQNS